MVEIERLTDLSQNAVSFRVNRFALDYPYENGMTWHPAHLDGILYSHFHPDHFAQTNFSTPFANPVYVSHELPVLARRLNGNAPRFPGLTQLSPNATVEIPDLGRVTSIPFSHSSVDTRLLFIEAEDGSTIVYSADNRMGNRTVEGLERLAQIVGTSGVDLLIADASKLGKDRLTAEGQIQRIGDALQFAGNSPASIYIRAGDYGILAHWLENHLFDDRQVFFSREIADMLGPRGLNWQPLLRKRYGLEITELTDPAEQLDGVNGPVILYDIPQRDPLQDPLVGIPHIVLNTGRQAIPYRTEFVTAVFAVGISGHDAESFYQLMEVTQPRFIAESHPATEANVSAIYGEKRILARKGDIVRL